MSVRREGREAAVQYLYSLEQNPEPEASDLRLFWSIHQSRPKARDFAEQLISGVLPRREELDDMIRSALQNWQFSRLEVVDRNILRVAIFEMFHVQETPPVVAINEAIEIARRLGTTDSPKFVNGILDRLKERLNRPLRTTASAPAQDVEAGNGR